ncbi:MAG: hypothetical protein ABW352_08470 [Polyangiales bacterium]
MDELPNDLREMLDLARDGYDPPDDAAQRRVRMALAAAIGAPAGAAVLTGGKAAAMGSQAPVALAGKSGWLALGGKLTAAAVGTVAAAGIGYAVYTSRAPVAEPTSVRPAVVQAAPAAEPTIEAPVVAEPTIAEPALEQRAVEEQEPAVAPDLKLKPRKAAPVADTLGDEMALLRSASEALARSDEAGALVHLHTHAKRYPRGSLREERDGLRAIAECTRDQQPSQDAAQRFARQYPNSVLGARVATACRAR